MSKIDTVLSSLESLNARMQKYENEERVRADSVARRAREIEVERHNAEQIKSDHACRGLQAEFDEILQPWGRSAPRPAAGENLDHYKRRLGNELVARLPQRHPMAQIDCLRLRNDALDAIMPQIVKAATEAAVSADSVPAGHIEMRKYRDSDSGHVENRFYGKQSFVVEMGRPSKRAILPTINEIAQRQKSGIWQ
ncbi:hypothetical protein [Rhodoblastus sp.]|jgi:hypothetical protein|uniref:hypothetical protein n=1 Tax=Rhodoblastus sp. TaxID=1962975 RepID=UPI0025D03D5C|nr:hypothetical protein [Rhodoblastus sp.]